MCNWDGFPKSKCCYFESKWRNTCAKLNADFSTRNSLIWTVMKRVIFYLNGTDLKTICVNQIRMILTIDQPWEMPQVFLMNAEWDRPTHIEFFSREDFPPCWVNTVWLSGVFCLQIMITRHWLRINKCAATKLHSSPPYSDPTPIPSVRFQV